MSTLTWLHVHNESPPTAIVADAMREDVICVEQDVTIPELLQLLEAYGISGMPVVNNGRAVGVVSKSDVVRTLSAVLGAPRAMAEMTVEDIMSPLVFSVAPDTALERAAALMAFEGVHRVPVVADGRIVGLLTSIDVLRWMARLTGFVIPPHTTRQ